MSDIKLETLEIVSKIKKAEVEGDRVTFNNEFDKLVPKTDHPDGSQTISLDDIMDTMFKHELIE